MTIYPLEHLRELLTGVSLFLVLMWTGLLALSIGLLVLMYTRWGQLQPLRKCAVLSLLAHLLVAGYSTTVYVAPSGPPEKEQVVRVFLDASQQDRKKSSPKSPDRTEMRAVIATPAPAAPPILKRAGEASSSKPKAKETTTVRAVLKTAGEVAPEEKLSRVMPDNGPEQAETMAEPGAWRAARAAKTVSTSITATTTSPPVPPAHGSYQVPEIYKLRVSPDRSEQAMQHGAKPQSEAAVAAALQWIGANQEPDGRWSASKHGGGREELEAGRERFGAGNNADTAVTGLAILALAASGNTHQSGKHQAEVRAGLEYLLQVQGADGNLAGSAALYEFMYSHGMATLAMAEILGMTGDEALREPLIRAVNYTLAAQDPIGGGWRYRPGEPGDTSQLGWQLMALKSAELAGLRTPDIVWQRAARYLQSVSAGEYGGLASYRPGERITRSMTAEGLACRLFLGLSPQSATASEAADFLLNELPGSGEPNLYYWYYATMAMNQLQGSRWKEWTMALQKTLLSTQQTTGALAGSWDPNTRWDGYGGRVYSTSLATLCLEAYYRFLPLQPTADPGISSSR